MSGCIILGRWVLQNEPKMVHQYLNSRSALVEAICPEKMAASPDQIEVINVVDPFQTAGSAEPCVESQGSAEPVDPSVGCWQCSDPLIKR